MYLICATGGTVLIVLSPEYSHAMYLDSSKNLRKKDYKHIKSVLDSAMLTFGHKTDFCCIQQPHSSMADGFYLMHRLIEYRRDNQRLRLSATTIDAEIVNWATNIGTTPDH